MMWQKVDMELAEEVRYETSSVWKYKDLMLVGVMRTSYLLPPVLWATLLRADKAELRAAPEKLDDLQRLIYSPLIYAEAALNEGKHQKFLLFLGFEEIMAQSGRKLYQRSL